MVQKEPVPKDPAYLLLPCWSQYIWGVALEHEAYPTSLLSCEVNWVFLYSKALTLGSDNGKRTIQQNRNQALTGTGGGGDTDSVTRGESVNSYFTLGILVGVNLYIQIESIKN